MRVDQVILTIDRSVRQIVQALKGRLELIENIQCVIVEIPDTGPAATTLTIDHNLGKIPTAYFFTSSKHTTAIDFSKGTWTETQMTLRFSAANCVVTLVVF
jgi:hypothetical protein